MNEYRRGGFQRCGDGDADIDGGETSAGSDRTIDLGDEKFYIDFWGPSLDP